MTDTSDLANKVMNLSRILAASKKHGMTYAVWDRDISNTEAAATALTAKDKEIEALRERLKAATQSRDTFAKWGREAMTRADTAERRVAELEAKAAALFLAIPDDVAARITCGDLQKRAKELLSAERERDEARAALKPLIPLAEDAAKKLRQCGSPMADKIDQLARAARAVIKQGE